VILGSNPLTPLEHLLRHVLDWLHGSVGLPWAWSIVALTVLVRMLLVPLTVRQIHSMQNMQRFAPQMKEIQRKYKGDRERLNEELMKFYRENKINPAASCLPLLAQFPVFLALYFALRTLSKQAAKCEPVATHAANSCQALLGDVHPNFHWLGLLDITNKASSGWGPLLLVIYAASQTLSTLLMSTTMDKTQRAILLVMPVAFLAVVANFKAGLVLYWVTTNLWTVGQGIVTRRLVPKTPAPPRRSSRTPPKARPDDGDADGAKQIPEKPKPAPAAAAAPPRKVRRKKKKRARR
jgi:YidC/Oxa1 family membrane protein insertase